MIFVISHIHSGISLKIFQSKPGEVAESQKISSAKLKNYPEEILPQQFVLCSSSLQGRIGVDTKTIYVIYNEENYQHPWLSIGFWEKGVLWANLEDREWYLLGQVMVSDLFRWIHICVEIDLMKSTIKTSINGKNNTIVHDVKKISDIPKLYLVLGVVDNSWYEEQYQFNGQITNIQLLKVHKKMTTVPSNHCRVSCLERPQRGGPAVE